MSFHQLGSDIFSPDWPAFPFPKTQIPNQSVKKRYHRAANQHIKMIYGRSCETDFHYTSSFW